LKVFAEVSGLVGVDSARSGSLWLLYFLLYFCKGSTPSLSTPGLDATEAAHRLAAAGLGTASESPPRPGSPRSGLPVGLSVFSIPGWVAVAADGTALAEHQIPD